MGRAVVGASPVGRRRGPPDAGGGGGITPPIAKRRVSGGGWAVTNRDDVMAMSPVAVGSRRTVPTGWTVQVSLYL